MPERDNISAEDRLISRFFKPMATHPGALGLADDVAVLTPPAGNDLVLKTDAVVGGVHFFPEDAAQAVFLAAIERGIAPQRLFLRQVERAMCALNHARRRPRTRRRPPRGAQRTPQHAEQQEDKQQKQGEAQHCVQFFTVTG